MIAKKILIFALLLSIVTVLGVSALYLYGTSLIKSGYENTGSALMTRFHRSSPFKGWGERFACVAPVLQSSISLQNKWEYLNEVFKLPTDMRPSCDQIYRDLNKLKPSFWTDDSHKMRAMIVTAECVQWSHRVPISSAPLPGKMATYYGGWPVLLKKTANPYFYHAVLKTIRRSEAFLQCSQTSIFENQTPSFLLSWPFPKDYQFYENMCRAMPAIKKQNLSYYWQKLFIDYDIAGFPASVDLPLKMTDPKQKLAVLNNALDHWKLLHNGLVIIHNKTDYQALESAWRLFNNLGQEAMIDRKMRQLTFTSSSWLALSYMLARSADISPRFKQRVDQGLEPFYDHIVPAPVTDFEEFMRAMPVLGLLKKLYMDNPALYPKYLYYGQALDRSLISFSGHITSLSAQDLAKLFFFIDFLEIKNPQKARAVTDLIIREEFGSYMSVSSFGSLGRDPKIRKLMQLSTLLTQQLTVSAARYFLENHPVTTDNAGNFLKAAWSWEDQSKDLFYFKPLYRLVAYFMAEDVYDFLQTHPAHDQRPLLRELTVLDPEIPEKDQIHSIKTYFQKLAVNVAQGNWRYIFYKIKTRLMDEGNFTDPITLRDSHDLQLLWPRAYNVKDLRQKDRTVAHLFIMDPQKGARVVAIKFDMGLKHGGVSTAKFIKYHPATKLALTFTLDFTDTLGKTKDIAIDRGSVKNWYMSTHRALGLIVVYKNGAMKIFDKSHLRISDLYFHPQDSPYTDRALDLRKIDDYFLLLQIAQVQQLSVAANNLLIDNNTTFSMPSSKGSQRLLLEFSDGRDGLLNVESYVTTNAATRIARALTLKNSAKVVKAVYLDTGFYDYLTVHTTKGDVALGHSDNPVSSNRMFWGI